MRGTRGRHGPRAAAAPGRNGAGRLLLAAPSPGCPSCRWAPSAPPAATGTADLPASPPALEAPPPRTVTFRAIGSGHRRELGGHDSVPNSPSDCELLRNGDRAQSPCGPRAWHPPNPREVLRKWLPSSDATETLPTGLPWTERPRFLAPRPPSSPLTIRLLWVKSSVLLTLRDGMGKGRTYSENPKPFLLALF